MSDGLIKGLVVGVAALVITIIIAFVVIQSVEVIDDDISTALTHYVDSETGFYLNGTIYSVANAGRDGFSSFSIVKVVNTSDSVVILAGNYTVGATGTITNATADWVATYPVTLTYSYTYKPTETTGDLMISNFTSGIDNVSGKIPTILLIAAVVLVLSILGLLWIQYQKADIGSGSKL